MSLKTIGKCLTKCNVKYVTSTGIIALDSNTIFSVVQEVCVRKICNLGTKIEPYQFTSPTTVSCVYVSHCRRFLGKTNYYVTLCLLDN